MKLTARLTHVLQAAHDYHFSVSGTMARESAPEVGALASAGLITTRIMHDTYGKQWVPTPEGIAALNTENAACR